MARSIGILMLDTRFPRLPGDVGNPASFEFPVRYKVVDGATPDAVVAPADQARRLLPRFIAAGHALEHQGVAGIVTSCGFLAAVQNELAAALTVPVVTSSLVLVPSLRAMLGPGRSIGILTAHAGWLSAEHLTGAGIAPDWPVTVRGMETSPAFAAAILENGLDMNSATVEAEALAVARALVAEAPDTAALVLECTNLQPYAPALRAALGLPVYGINHAAALLHAGMLG